MLLKWYKNESPRIYKCGVTPVFFLIWTENMYKKYQRIGMGKRQHFLLLALLAVSLYAWKPSTPLSEAEKKGRQIFTEGTSPDGQEVFALMSDIKVPASVLPCASCHGIDGTGREEGGVSPSNITWASLTTPYAGVRKSDRAHPAYDEKSLKRAITMGLDPAGNQLNTSMPKYQMSHEDLSNLIAYIKILGLETTAGVEDNELHIGMLPSPNPAAKGLNQATQQVVQAYFTEINENGGIYGRKLQLHLPAPAGQLSAPGAATTFLNQQPLFALVNSFYSQSGLGAEETLGELPVVGAIDPMPIRDFTRNHHLFYLYPGLDDLAQGLARFTDGQSGSNALTVVYQADGIRERLAQIVAQSRLRPTELIAVKEASSTELADQLGQLKSTGTENLCVLLPPHLEGELVVLLSEWNWSPRLYLIGSLTQMNPMTLDTLFDEKIFLAYPIWMSSTNEKGAAYYQFLTDKYQLPPRYRQSQLAALASAMLLVKGLENTGRKLTHAALIEQLEGIYHFESGLIPPLTYGPNRRVGSDVVFIAQLQVTSNRMELVEELHLQEAR